MTTVEHDPDTGLRRRSCACVECFYCEVVLPPRHEHDHFPVPAALRGAETVPACINCHEWKDRTPVGAWPLDLQSQGLAAVLQSADVAALGGDILPRLGVLLRIIGDYRQHWAGWPWAARLYYAKMTVIDAREDLLRRLRLCRALWASPSYRDRPINVLADDMSVDRKIVAKVLDRDDLRTPDVGEDVVDIWDRAASRVIVRMAFTVADMPDVESATRAMLAEFELSILRARTREGMAIARGKGKLRGKQPKLNAAEQAHLIDLYRAGDSVPTLAALFKIARGSVYRAIQRGQAAVERPTQRPVQDRVPTAAPALPRQRGLFDLPNSARVSPLLAATPLTEDQEEETRE